jgi:hypothetical protein
LPTPTFIIYKDGTVTIKDANNLSAETERIHFAATVVECCPKVRRLGFNPYVSFSTVAYQCNRVGIEYRRKDNKIILAYRTYTGIYRFKP